MVQRTKKKRIVFTAILCVAITVFIYLTVTAVSIWNYGNVDEKRQADAAIVLGAETINGEPSPVFRERINHGIWIYENGYVDYLIFTGGIGDGNPVSEAYIAKQYAISKGVPEEAILIEEKSTITEENLEQSKIIMDDHSLSTAIIISDPLHMKRAMLMAKDYGIQSYSSPTPTTMYRSIKTQLPFLVREEFFYIGYAVVRLFRLA